MPQSAPDSFEIETMVMVTTLNIGVGLTTPIHHLIVPSLHGGSADVIFWACPQLHSHSWPGWDVGPGILTSSIALFPV